MNMKKISEITGLSIFAVYFIFILWVVMMAYFMLMVLQIFFDNYRFRFQSPLRTPIWIESIKKPTPMPVRKMIIVKPTVTPTPTKKAQIEPVKKYFTAEAYKTREKVLAIVSKHYSGDELTAFDNLMKKEAGYRYDAVNEIGACGIGQALPCSKMNCPLDESGIECQANWVMQYIKNRYKGSPVVAWNFWLSNSPGWY